MCIINSILINKDSSELTFDSGRNEKALAELRTARESDFGEPIPQREEEPRKEDANP